MSNGQTVDLESMIDKPTEYGFDWGYGELHKKGMQIAAKAPHIVHVDLTRMREVFGDQYFLDSANGQSARVRDQAIRDDIWDNRKLASDDRAMKRIILERAFGNKRSRARGPVFLGLDGKQYSTQLDMQQANLGHLVDKGLDVEQAKLVLGIS